ncbi:unnamed protein product [Euphydryas editha]|uniref:Uncharacterized protein n=1 Tax=Euphydryas editha TaxID=104508 RepID=A0AAU9UWM2_EUPED|nr:unnamed protein product [Euphydryas editha]
MALRNTSTGCLSDPLTKCRVASPTFLTVLTDLTPITRSPDKASNAKPSKLRQPISTHLELSEPPPVVVMSWTS